MFDKIVKFVNELAESGFVNKIGKDEYSLVMKHFYGNSDSPLYIEDVKTHISLSHHRKPLIHSTDCKGRLIVSGKENKIWESSYRHMFNQILQNHYGDIIVCNTELKVLIDTLNQVREMFRGVGKDHEIISRMMVNSIYVAINNRTDIIDKEEFNNIVERMFDNTVDTIVEAGGYPIFCELDKFIYVSPSVIDFESSTHDDRLKNILVVDGYTYVADVDQKKSKRVRPVDVDNPKHLRYFNNLK
ncbi:hypothetical protein ASswx1_42 [Aeromonas phage Asswx_1]|uniref:Uncharacterized protein n=1 Tax=Aeromonas phage Asswx_1 TaxID=2419739 RepID=A0A411B7V2_9CAUD|nr:hypothetical protein ASswx1_42 [Aeromonas phage Asswx_1]